jgi:hypothetical protein
MIRLRNEHEKSRNHQRADEAADHRIAMAPHVMAMGVPDRKWQQRSPLA